MLAIPAIHESDVTTAEDVAVSFGYTVAGTDGSVVYVDIGLTENVSVGVASRLVFGLPVVESTATAEYIAQHMTAPHSDVSFAWLINCTCARRYSTTTNGCNFATTIHTVTYDSVPQFYVGNIDI